MPESSTSPTQENRLSQQSMDMPMERHDDDLSSSDNVLCLDSPGHMNTSLNSAKSVESLNTLLMSMPEISIPSPVYNPLPLQCLAVSALPAQLREEIDGVIAEYALMSTASCELECSGGEVSVIDESSIAQAVGVCLHDVHRQQPAASVADRSRTSDELSGNVRDCSVEQVSG